MSNSLSHLLLRIRRRIRLYLLVESSLAVAIAIVVLFWTGLALDWWLEPSRGVRIAAWSIVGFSLAVLFHRYGWSRLRQRLSNANLALLVERAHPELGDRLLTVVAPVRAENSEAFLDLSARQAWELSRNYKPDSIVTLKPLGRLFLLALVLVGTVVGFALWQKEAFGTWVDRLALSNTSWPRRVDLVIEGFEPDERGRLVRNVPKFASTEIVVRANLTRAFEAPSEVEIRFRTPGESMERGLFTRVGNAEKGRDKEQVYRYQFAELNEPLELEIRGGDVRLQNLWIEVLPRPRMTELHIDAEYPDYLAKSPRKLSATSVITVPIGTKLTLHGRASQPIEQVDVAISVEGLAPPIASVDSVDRHYFQIPMSPLPSSGELSLLPIDSGGVKARDPYVLTLIAQDDEIPTAMLQLAGIGTAITHEAQLPLHVRAEDDHAIHRLWIDLLVDGNALSTHQMEIESPHSTAEFQSRIDFAALMDAKTRQIELQPGQVVTLAAKAEDGWNLSEAARIGSSRTIVLDVVTADQLMDQLEREEINLRRTFERVIEKTTQSGQKLNKVSFAETPQNNSADQQISRLELARVVDDVQQITAESLGVGAGFQLIHDQLVNNRIGDQDLKSRLQERIAEPLRLIAEKDLRLLASSIVATSQKPRPTEHELEVLASRTTEVVDRMLVVLKEMKALETYSEVVSMLRKLIREQETLTDRTRKFQRQQLQTLLDDE